MLAHMRVLLTGDVEIIEVCRVRGICACWTNQQNAAGRAGRCRSDTLEIVFLFSRDNISFCFFYAPEAEPHIKPFAMTIHTHFRLAVV